MAEHGGIPFGQIISAGPTLESCLPKIRQREVDGRCSISRSAQEGRNLFHGLCGEKVASRRALIRGADVFAMILSIVQSSSQEDGYLKLAGNQAKRPVRVAYSGEAEDSRGKNR